MTSGTFLPIVGERSLHGARFLRCPSIKVLMNNKTKIDQNIMDVLSFFILSLSPVVSG